MQVASARQKGNLELLELMAGWRGTEGHDPKCKIPQRGRLAEAFTEFIHLSVSQSRDSTSTKAAEGQHCMFLDS